MIQSTASTLTAALLPIPGASAAAVAPGEFAALLGGSGLDAMLETPDAGPNDASLTHPDPGAAPLAETVKGVQNGLEALATQAGAVSPPTSLDPEAAIPVFSAPSRIALTMHMAAGSNPAAPEIALPAAVTADAMGRIASARGAVPTGEADNLRAVSTVPAAHQATLPDGKSGKAGGKMLPPTPAAPASAENRSEDVPDAPANSEPATGAGEKTPQSDAAPVVVPASDNLVAVPAVILSDRKGAPKIPPPDIAAPATDHPSGKTAASMRTEAAVSPQIRAIRFEPIQLVRTPVYRAAPATETAGFANAMEMSSQPSIRAPGEAAAMPAALGVAPERLRVAQPVAAVSASAKPTTAPLPAMQQQGAADQPAPDIAAGPPVKPAIASPTDIAKAPLGPDAQTIAPQPRRAAPVAVGETAKRPAASDHAAARAAPQEPQPVAPSPVSAPLTATGIATPEPVAAPAPATLREGPQDFDTLVSRLAEAREAAAPHVVRTAFDHAEFGRVALQLGQDENGLSVTLSSRDATFAPAVQAAAVAATSGAAGGGMSDQARSDNASSQQQQQNAQAQNTQAQNTQAQNGQQARADGSASQQPRRDGTSAGTGGNTGQRQQDPQQPATAARPRDARRPGGVYA